MILPAWLIITVIALVIFIVLFRTMNQVYILSMIKDNFFWFFLVLVLLFMTISLTRLHKTYDFDFTSFEGFKEAGKIYFSWLGGVAKNSARVTGYAVQQDWVNITNSTSP